MIPALVIHYVNLEKSHYLNTCLVIGQKKGGNTLRNSVSQRGIYDSIQLKKEITKEKVRLL
jgi:hypothetical protein